MELVSVVLIASLALHSAFDFIRRRLSSEDVVNLSNKNLRIDIIYIYSGTWRITLVQSGKTYRRTILVGAFKKNLLELTGTVFF